MERDEEDEDFLGVEEVLKLSLEGKFSSTMRGLDGASMKREPGGRGPDFGLRELK